MTVHTQARVNDATRAQIDSDKQGWIQVICFGDWRDKLNKWEFRRNCRTSTFPIYTLFGTRFTIGEPQPQSDHGGLCKACSMSTAYNPNHGFYSYLSQPGVRGRSSAALNEEPTHDGDFDEMVRRGLISDEGTDQSTGGNGSTSVDSVDDRNATVIAKPASGSEINRHTSLEPPYTQQQKKRAKPIHSTDETVAVAGLRATRDAKGAM
ncbi:hypothetical protein BJ742DRAFT_737378 [Cladochytrium replicatum]|nr:hypothetical protein BJ742DRAFT_737378 [Cladochytrium replicatum]